MASYARMAWKVANYNALRGEADTLRTRYRSLQKEVTRTNEQLASLELYAKEVSIAYGIRQRLEGPARYHRRRQAGPQFLRKRAGLRLPPYHQRPGHDEPLHAAPAARVRATRGISRGGPPDGIVWGPHRSLLG